MATSDDVANEIVALRAIYGDDFEDRPDVWNNTSFAIKIRPIMYADADIHSRVSLVITLNQSYPKTVPRIELVDVKGLSTKEVEELKAQLAKVANDNLGEIMVHEIASATESYLELHNRKPQTFYEKMQTRQKNEEEALKTLKDGSLFESDEIPTSSEGNVDAIPPRVSLTESASESNIVYGQKVSAVDFRRQHHSGERGVSVGSDVGDTVGGGEDWLNTLLKRQSMLTMGADQDEGDSFSSDDDNVKDKISSRGYHTVDGGSRYQKEFQEITLLGRGGGGEVWKVKNSLDRRPYAVKKILLNPTDGARNSKIRREVTTISRLLHKNIVRYYAAWVERVIGLHNVQNNASGQRQESEDLESSSASLDSAVFKKFTPSFGVDHFQDLDVEFDINAVYANDTMSLSEDSYSDESESESESQSDSSSSSSGTPYQPSFSLHDVDSADSGGIEFVDSNHDQREDDESSYTQHVDCDDESHIVGNTERVNNSDINESGGQPIRYLYIQMEFCDATLKDAINGGMLWQELNEVMRLFRQLLDAISYIHSQGVIHRDLKPANIFLDSEGNIKIGDFGLATTSRHRMSSVLSDEGIAERAHAVGDFEDSLSFDRTAGSVMADNSMASFMSMEFSDTLTGGVGTALYRAPEQEGGGESTAVSSSASRASQNARIKGKTGATCKSRSYDAKADMFSLGIILFEMCHEPFGTGMERVKTITALRSVDSAMPAAFVSRVPENMQSIIKWLVEVDPAKRPTAEELQSSPLMPPRIHLDKSYLDEVMHGLTIPNSEIATRVLSTLFARRPDHEDMTYDMETLSNVLRLLKLDSSFSAVTGTSVSSVSTRAGPQHMKKVASLPDALARTETQLFPLQTLEMIRHAIEGVFLCHGAARLSPSLLHPLVSDKCTDKSTKEESDTKYGLALHCAGSSWEGARKRQDVLAATNMSDVFDTGYQSVELMDRGGVVVQLPSELVSGYARYVSRLGISNACRYAIDTVYRERSGRSMADGHLAQQHPLQSLEAVFDIIREVETTGSRSAPALDKSVSSSDSSTASESDKRAFIEVDVIMTAVEIGNAIDPKNSIGHRFLRIGDSRLSNAILDLCAAPHPRARVLRAFSAICDNAIVAHMVGAKYKDRALSGSELCSQAYNLIKSIGLPEDVQRALRPFVKIIAMSSGAKASIDAIEKTFYSHPVITAIQKQINMMTSTSNEKVPSVNKNTTLGKSTSASRSANDLNADVIYTKKDLKRYTALLRKFDDAVKHVKDLLKLMEECHTRIPCIGGEVSTSTRGIAFQHGTSSHSEEMGHSQPTKSKSDSFIPQISDRAPSVGELPHVPTHTGVVVGMMQRIHLDIGIDTHVSVSPYDPGFFFQLEALGMSIAKSSKRVKNAHPEIQHHILCQGGHFDHAIQAARPPSISKSVGMPSIVAFGMRASVTRLLDLLLVSTAKNSGAHNSQQLIPRALRDLPSLPLVLVVGSDVMGKNDALFNMEKTRGKDQKGDIFLTTSTRSKFGQISLILCTLRAAGIRASDRLHQLQGPGAYSSTGTGSRGHVTWSEVGMEEVVRIARSQGVAFIISMVAGREIRNNITHAIEPCVRVCSRSGLKYVAMYHI